MFNQPHHYTDEDTATHFGDFTWYGRNDKGKPNQDGLMAFKVLRRTILQDAAVTS